MHLFDPMRCLPLLSLVVLQASHALKLFQDKVANGDGAHNDFRSKRHTHTVGHAHPNPNECSKGINQSDISSFDFRLTKAKVPVKETTYTCQTYDLNVTSDLHMISVMGLIESPQVVHHILIFGCDPRGPPERVTGRPEECRMMPPTFCRNLIGAWTMGAGEQCIHPRMGFRVGPRGYRQVFMQVHFHNPTHLKDIIDSSGLRLRFSKSLRPNDAGMLVVGLRSLQIEPLAVHAGGEGTSLENVDTHNTSTGYVSSKHSVSFTSQCPGRCTQHMFGEGIYITGAANHMHSLGISQRIEVYRNNSLVHVVTDQEGYIYNHPVFYHFDEPLHVLPGDELRTTCVYKRPPSGYPVCFGEGTADEMCFGFLTYFPSQNLVYPWCTTMGSMVSCDRHLPQLGKQPISDCRWWEFRDLSQSETKIMFGRVLMTCYSKQGGLNCSDDCKDVVNGLLSHPCMKNDVGTYMMNRIKLSGTSGQQLMDALVTCSCRHFPYCDRKLPKGILGSKQLKWCATSLSVPCCVPGWFAVLVLVCLSLLC